MCLLELVIALIVPVISIVPAHRDDQKTYVDTTLFITIAIERNIRIRPTKILITALISRIFYPFTTIFGEK